MSKHQIPTPAPAAIRYFVTFVADGGRGIGNVDISLAKPIRSGDDIAGITQMLSDAGYMSPTITGWQRFEQ